ncbi:putative phage-related protein Lin1244/Lin1753 [Frankliniella fusca]|uniref:Phage-related protein Lin1244/Lin1753 n=1 Tax=Frankliniella fusca TaxID=407009 RepID=A0AAE1GXF4_9NEOP|nr:putative phage-related protein Lin1244/Lin1753 [Frankliniella fusca]
MGKYGKFWQPVWEKQPSGSGNSDFIETLDLSNSYPVDEVDSSMKVKTVGETFCALPEASCLQPEVATTEQTQSHISISNDFNLTNHTKPVFNDFDVFEDDDKEDNSSDSILKAALTVWAIQHKIGRNALTDLLHILRDHNHPHLPLSSKTLLKTPRSTVNLFTTLGNGLFWYYGILQCLIPRLSNQYLQNLQNGCVVIDIFVDGVSPYKSVKNVLWPICGCIAGSWDIFIIGLWCGVSKEPGDLKMFFEEFIREAKQLKNGFMHLGFQLKLRIRRFIADAPARTWMKNVNQHGSYFACERCTAEGVWFGNRMTYALKEVTDVRTDQSLAQRLDTRYHKGTCPLTELNVKLVSEMPLEPLHLLWLGITKRILMNLLGQKRNSFQFKFSDTLKVKIDSMSEYISQFYPSEFARKPRKWTDYSLFKATDYRRIALYDGLLLLKTAGVNQHIYINFCLFSCAVRILSDQEYVDKFADDAQMLLEKFIENSISIYGKTFNVYNVHHLKHLTEDCQRHGDLESFSAFKFESHLGLLKRLLHAPGRTLPQIVCRLLEQIFNRPTSQTPQIKNVEVSIPCSKGFEEIVIPHIRVKMTAGKSFFLSTERKIVKLQYIIENCGSYLLVGHRFKKQSDFFKYPIPSSALDIYEVEELSGVESCWTVNQVKKKCVVIPIPTENQPLPKGFIGSKLKCLALPMLHGGDEYRIDHG